MDKDTATADQGGKAHGAYHHGDLRAALIAAAAEQVEREGPEGVHLSRLAKALGVSQPAPYRHFDSREALLSAVAQEGFSRYSAEVDAAGKQGSRFAAPAKIVQAHVAFGLAHAGLYRLIFASRGREAPEMAAAFEVLFQAVRDVGYGQGARRRAVRLWAAAHGVVMLADQGLFEREVTTMPLIKLIEDIIA